MKPGSSQRVCVIGAGVAGLVAARVLRDDGFDVTVYEKESSPGGVWAPSRTYPGLRANNPADTYAFSDFPYPDTVDEFPTAAQVRSYLEAYVDRFELRSLLQLSTEVIAVAASGSGPPRRRYRVTIRSAGGATVETHPFDFVAVCNGVFSVPHLPVLAGRSRFGGLVLHSSQIADPSVLVGKRVLVVGAGKSALDCASVAAAHGASCTLAFRSAHWMLPRYILGLVRFDRLFVTRFAEMLFPLHYRPSRAEAALHGAGAPLVRAWWRGQTWLLQRLSGMPPAMRPRVPLPYGLENSGVGDDGYRLIARRQVRAVPADDVSFTGPDTVALGTEEIGADVVICATGWRQDVSFLDDRLRSSILRDGHFDLYRHILPPREPHIGFVGYASSTACPFTSELAAHWLSQCFRGELTLPPIPEMEQEIARVRRWAAGVFPARAQGYFIGTYIMHYADLLMSDMRLPTRRTRTLLAEYFAPFRPARYRDVAAQRRKAQDDRRG